mmetsp:Transcript_15005/g.35756  ORF Transcript_15005/g.35756 Transcript_15005/m.35756 type:complete len:114 (-) Transcript_15005:487-828(-)
MQCKPAINQQRRLLFQRHTSLTNPLSPRLPSIHPSIHPLCPLRSPFRMVVVVVVCVGVMSIVGAGQHQALCDRVRGNGIVSLVSAVVAVMLMVVVVAAAAALLLHQHLTHRVE